MIDELFEAIRDAVPAGEWSNGVTWARAKAVVGERDDGDEITLRVLVGSRQRSFEVTLWPEDEEWQCDCPGSDNCGHVAAAVIALRQARRGGQRLPHAEVKLDRLGYRLRVVKGQLEIQRVRVRGDVEEPHTAPVTTELTHERGPALVTSQGDLMAERALGTWRRGVIPRSAMAPLLAALARCEDVQLGGAPIEVCEDPVTPKAVVSDARRGFMLRLVPADGVAAMYANGAVVVAGQLRPVGDGGLSQRELSELPQGRYYRAEDAGELVTDIIPSLKRRIPVDIQTDRLPTGELGTPRLLIDVRDEQDQLVVLPTLVYGDPPTARVDRGQLVLLGGALPLRDRRAEKLLSSRLARQLGLEAGRAARLSGEEAVALSAKLARFSLGDVVGDAHEQYFLSPPLQGDVAVDDDGAFSVSFSSDGQPADAGRVMRAWRRGLNLAPLEGGGWAPLPHDWLRRYGQIIHDLLVAKADKDELPPAAFGDLARLCDALERPLPPKFARLRVLVEGFEGIPTPTLPADLTAELRPYQRDGVAWLSFLRSAGLGGLLADDMGLGKTLQALCAVAGRTLVVAPTSVVHNWATEAAKFRPSLSVNVYHGPKRRLDPAADLTLTTYAILRLDIDRLAGERWDTVALDEAQAIKNPDSQVARAAFRLDAGFRLTLTGTPVENRLDDLWSQLHFLNPGLLGGRPDFKEAYVDPIAAGDAVAALRLRERVRPFVLRRLKRDVAPELPPRTDLVLHCELSAYERDVYDALRAATRKEVVAQLQGGGSVIAALEALLRLRQAACHPALLPGRDADESAKTEVLMELLEEAVAEDHKALVFSQWTSMLDLVEPHLEAAGIPFVRLDGATRDRAGAVETFQRDDGPPVMLLSLKAGGTGLNLTAADHVVLMDPWWNPAAEEQAADRAHRIGQDKPVFVHRLVARDTVEEGILALQANKRALAEAAVGDASRAASITRDELLALLS